MPSPNYESFNRHNAHIHICIRVVYIYLHYLYAYLFMHICIHINAYMLMGIHESPAYEESNV